MKIALVCSAGMSTSMLVKKMREEAGSRDINAEINAYAEADLQSHLEDIDVILIGPQVRYLKKQMTERAAQYKTPVDIIDQIAYGMMNGAKVLDQAIELTQ
ncbi:MULTISPECIES: PTS sugar transporter subunit IIB [Bacillus]|uniref:PTS sugar transporter subunit IIB n=1 Tax=Bacillus TaxID=1386 RepID=UPI00047BB295|nr:MULTISPECIES: PTS sugar transporter subunit IIB [Bacillus]QHZ48717.1 PTS sugar transporter subunit IIB [Bacillus sp. NSP9.1]WFA05638.1 PTS sugar transporter subunit IIB [Bacillus sp. HSf4]